MFTRKMIITDKDNEDGQDQGVDMTHTDFIQRLQLEKELVERLNAHLQRELDLITEGNVQTLEESMPSKQKLLKGIADNRQGQEEPKESLGLSRHKECGHLKRIWSGSGKRQAGLTRFPRSL